MDVGTYSSRNLGNPRKLAWKSGEGGGKEEESRNPRERRGRDRKPKEVERNRKEGRNPTASLLWSSPV